VPRNDISTPASGNRPSIYYDPEAFGNFSEAIARNLGTARFLVIQTAVVAAWITINVVAVGYRWDPYPFILLNLAFSTQAAYAAPLILLAQNRQDERDRAQIIEDRDVASRTQADTEYLAREIASIRLALDDVVSTADLHESLDAIRHAIEALAEQQPAS
jgi:uncharacterized membrane protein